MFHFHQQKRSWWPYLALVILLLWLGAAIYLYHWWQQNGIGGVFQSAEEEIEQELGVETDMFLELTPHILGFRRPQTILVLFQNNTELRPGGGFIGSYAVVRIDRGKVRVIKTEGSENLDWQAPEDWRVEPPAPLKEKLGVDRWYFRDSNWSPDWTESARRALEFYQAEGGVGGNEITMVVALTPTVLEELLRLTGPVTVDGISFGADNVTEELEYEVEVGYRERNIPKAERKALIGRLMQAVFARASAVAFTNLTKHIEVVNLLVDEKQILAYATDAEAQSLIDKHGLAGRVEDVPGDYLMWVDANLGALKTDHAIKREMRYEIREMVGKASMMYTHQGGFDWRTTRYRTYTRIFVPLGAEITAVIITGKSGKVLASEEVDQGQELGKQWFGAFITVEPGEMVEAQFIYRLPSTISDHIKNGSYTLFVQKQLGTIAHGLTLDLDFDTPITAATPGEEEREWGDAKYRVTSDLREDREFAVSLKHTNI